MRRPLCMLLLAEALAGCGGNGTGADLKPADLAQRPDLGCYPAPTTYEGLLNACTSAQAIDKTPVTPLLNQDGTLPKLP